MSLRLFKNYKKPARLRARSRDFFEDLSETLMHVDLDKMSTWNLECTPGRIGLGPGMALVENPFFVSRCCGKV